MTEITTEKKPQVNVQLEHAEMQALETICQAENITRPSVLVGVWIRENIKLHEGTAALMQVVREARDSGVDVVSVLTKAARRKGRA